ncbi:MAG: DUF4168 domain-containing protein [Thermosynechococcaceae cyanobacterium]
MTHFASSCVPSHPRLSRLHWWSVLLLAGSSCLTGVVPGWSNSTAQLSWSTTAFAQTTDQIRSYAEAVLDIEPLRRRAYGQVRKKMNGSVPGDVCRQGQLPGDVKSICSDFLGESADIIRRRNLTINQFNDITQRSQADPELRNRIQEEMKRRLSN